MNVVTKIGKRVVNTKIVRKVADKAASYPLVLTVEVKRLDGILVVNIPPPQTDTIWYVVWSMHLAIYVLMLAAPSLVPKPCAFVACSTKFTNFVLQATNAQGLGTRLSCPPFAVICTARAHKNGAT